MQDITEDVEQQNPAASDVVIFVNVVDFIRCVIESIPCAFCMVSNIVQKIYPSILITDIILSPCLIKDTKQNLKVKQSRN